MNTVSYILNLRDNFAPKLNKIQTELGKFEGMLPGINSGILAIGAALGGLSVGNSIIEATSNYEKFQAVLTNTFGSQKEAVESMKLIEEIAAKTPFQIDRLTESYVKLVNRGFKPTREQIISLGDLASAQGKDFDQLTEALLDAETMEFERLKEFGIKAKQSANSIKMTFKGVSTDIAKTPEAVRAYILSLGDAKGVAGGMAAISGTLGGKISNLQDVFTQLFTRIGLGASTEMKSFIDSMIVFVEKNTPAIVEATTNIVNNLKDFAKWVIENKDWLKALGVGVLTFIGIAKVLNTVLAITNFLMAANPVGIMVIGISALAAGFYLAYKKLEFFRNGVDKTWVMLKNFWGTLVDTYDTVTDGVIKMWETIKDIFEKIKSWFKTSFWGQALYMILIKPFEDLFSGIKEIWEKIKAIFTKKEIEVGVKDTTKYDLGKSPLAGYFSKFTKTDGGETPLATATKTMATTPGAAGTITSSPTGVSKIEQSAPRNFTINIDNLIKDFSVNTANLDESLPKIKAAVIRTLLDGLNDVSIIAT